jgi:hypothetical protein
MNACEKNDAVMKWVSDNCATKDGLICTAASEFAPKTIGENCRAVIGKGAFGNVKHSEDISDKTWSICQMPVVQQAVLADAPQGLTGGIGQWTKKPRQYASDECNMSQLDDLIQSQCGWCIDRTYMCLDPENDKGFTCDRTANSVLAIQKQWGIDNAPATFTDKNDCEDACTGNNWKNIVWPPPMKFSWDKGATSTWYPSDKKYGSAIMTCSKDAQGLYTCTSNEGNGQDMGQGKDKGQDMGQDKRRDKGREKGRDKRRHPQTKGDIVRSSGCIQSSSSSAGWHQLGAAGGSDDPPCSEEDTGPIVVGSAR